MFSLLKRVLSKVSVFIPGLFIVMGTVSTALPESPPELPYRVGGQIYIKGEAEPISQQVEAYRVVISRTDMTSLNPPAQDTDGLDNIENNYLLEIKALDETHAPGGALADEELVIHVYKDGTEMTVLEPVDGRITMGSTGANDVIDLKIQPPSGPGPGEDPLQGDINGDGRIGLEEAIHALQVTSGIK